MVCQDDQKEGAGGGDGVLCHGSVGRVFFGAGDIDESYPSLLGESRNVSDSGMDTADGSMGGEVKLPLCAVASHVEPICWVGRWFGSLCHQFLGIKDLS